MWSVTEPMVDVRWKDEDELLAKRVSAAEHLCSDWSQYDNECREAEATVNKLEAQLDAVIDDTDPQHVHTCLEQLQVQTQYTCKLPGIFTAESVFSNNTHIAGHFPR